MRIVFTFFLITALLGLGCKGKGTAPETDSIPLDTMKSLFDSLAVGVPVGKEIKLLAKPQTVQNVANGLNEGDTHSVFVWGKVLDVCHTAGCWMRLKSGSDSQDMFVSNLHESSYDTLFTGGFALVEGKVYWESFNKEDEAHLISESGNKKQGAVARKELVMEAVGARFWSKNP